MAGRVGEMKGDIIFKYYPSNLTLTIWLEYHKPTIYQLQTAFSSVSESQA